MRFTQIAVCPANPQDSSWDSIYALGEDGQIYTNCVYYEDGSPGNQEYWHRLDMPIGRDEAIKAFEAKKVTK